MSTRNTTPETPLFNANGVVITPTRAMLGGKTYAMSNITSVSMRTTKPNRTWGYILLVFGALMFFSGLGQQSGGAIALGLVLLAAGYFKGIKPKDTHHVLLGSASGEGEALSAFDRPFIEGIVNAMNEAIIQRG